MAMKVTYDRKSLMLDGKRKFIYSGTLHYYRLPSPVQWQQRLTLLKSLGMNTADIYFYWGYHSPAKGVYDFSGPRDVDLLLDMIEDAGLYLMARPGPYICSEVDGGGFPGWLLGKRELKLRCKENGKYVYDERYMRWVREWYEQIVPRIARRKNLILFQVENEYHFLPTPRGIAARIQGLVQRRFGDNFLFTLQSLGPVRAIIEKLQRRAFSKPAYRQSYGYIQELINMARELGIEVPIFHNDVESSFSRMVDVDIVGIDDYPVKAFDLDWRKLGNPFSGIDLIEEGHEAHRVKCPILIGETQGGWFDLWGGKGYPYNRKHLGPEALDLTLKSALAQGTAILNLFMAAGGTNWGYTASPDVYTSIDYAAPITEGGRISARGKAARAFSEFISRHEQDILEANLDPTYKSSNPKIFCRVRRAPSGKSFIYLRNTTLHAGEVEAAGQKVPVPAIGMTVLVTDRRGAVIDEYKTYNDPAEEPLPRAELPELGPWTFAYPADNPLEPDYDDSAWTEVQEGASLDMDAVGVHYGYTWYRGHLKGNPESVTLDARHCWAMYLNGVFLRTYDNFRNHLGSGDDMARSVRVNLPPRYLRAKENILTILVESLGHNKGFLEDLHNPRGIAGIFIRGAAAAWRVRGGLLPGEEGITPIVDLRALGLREKSRVSLPHQWPNDVHGVGLYQTDFKINLADPHDPPIGVLLSSASEKANIYINGWLIGRYWDSIGPQKLFYLPPGLLHPNGKNNLCLAVWRWYKPGGLGPVKLAVYP